MRIHRVTVDHEGRLIVPNLTPGQTMVVQVEPAPDTETLTLATARTLEEREAVVEDILVMAGQLRE